MGDDQLSTLPEALQALLGAPPLTEKKLLELSIAWPRTAPGSPIEDARKRMADALRVFVITWDPLEPFAPRPDAMATVNADPSGLELVVYIPRWSLAELADRRHATLAEVLAMVAGSAVMVAATRAGRLVGGLPGHGPPGSHAGSARRPRCRGGARPGRDRGEVEPVGRHRAGRDYRRGAAHLRKSRPRSVAGGAPARPQPAPGLRGCGGRRFGFPGELAECRNQMCAQHQREATAVIDRRLARANASNPDGWGALGDASGRLELPHLPNGLATRLAGAEEGMYVIPEPDVLAERARLVVEGASWFAGRPRELSLALGEESWAAAQLPDWLVNLPMDLGRAGLGTEAVAVGEALARVDPDGAATYQADVAVALAEAGLADQVHARLAAMLARWPDDFWCRVHAGDALAALGDVDGATSHFVIAQQMAEEADDFEARSDAFERLNELRRRRRAASDPDPPNRQRPPRHKLSRAKRARRNRRR